MNKRKISLLLVSVLLVVCVCIGISYAVWSLNLKQEGTNTIVTGCFNVTFSGINDINLNGAYPISDEEGASLTPYEFTITNTCEDVATYQINLEILNDSTLTDLSFIKEIMKEKGKKNGTRFLNTNPKTTPTIKEATEAYKLKSSTLEGKESKTYTFSVWLDYDTPPIEAYMNKILNSKITVTTNIDVPTETNNIMMAMNINNYGELTDVENLTYTQNNKYVLNEVVFENNINPYQNAIEIVDFSESQDKSVLGYYVEYAENVYNLYIQADGKIGVNPNGAYYFANLGFKVRGIENVDTSKVTDMSYMFSFCDDVDWEVNLEYFDTENVVTMKGMFLSSSFKALNISNFNTGKVTDMSWMFYWLKKTPSCTGGSKKA